MHNTRSRIYSAAIIAAGSLWGLMGLFVRGIGEYGFNSMQITCVRLVCGTAMLILFTLIHDRRLFKVEPRDIPVFAAMGIFSVLMMSVLYFEAINEITMSAAAILLYTAPIWVLGASVLFYGERLTLRKGAALVIAFGGCVMVSGLSGGSVSARGIICGFGSGFAYSLYSIIGKHALKKNSPITVTVYSFIFASVGSVLICGPSATAGLISQNICAPLAWRILGVGFVTVFAPYLLYTFGLSNTQAGAAAIMASAEPMTATLAGLVVYKEIPDVWGFLGVAMILTAIVLLNLREKKRMQN